MLTIQNLSAAYGVRRVLEDVSLTVAAGEVLAVIGPNGAGKSTLVRTVSGVLPLQSGQVSVGERPLHSLSINERARCLAVVPQARQLPGSFTVRETILLGRTPYLGWLGKSSRQDQEQVDWALERTCLVELAERKVGELSGGEQQRVLLARALVQAAPVLLLDEPTTHLDLQHQSSLLNLLRSLAAEQNLAVLIVLHDLNLASLYADRVALLVNGRIQAIGVPREVLTSANLTAVFHIPIEVIAHPAYGTPLVLPDGVAHTAVQQPAPTKLNGQSPFTYWQ
ncbi:MAG: heme ABC transporter ATP-binding protein [Ardenticatenaceae bacterium]|nr:heme ABC transporter ATP-binding protein [Ardenticatenaceae bacterium]